MKGSIFYRITDLAIDTAIRTLIKVANPDLDLPQRARHLPRGDIRPSILVYLQAQKKMEYYDRYANYLEQGLNSEKAREKALWYTT